MVSREKYEQFENKHLASYAQKSSDAKGRRYPEPKHPLRTEYQRDRERIVHCRAFRRLEYKTQVFVNSEGDHYRTRLTHTMEVAQIGRSISRILGLNEDLTEAIGLVHDVGHPPFGHTGESALNDLMADHGGFEHNLQSLRVVDELELKYPDFMGLNLTWEVREGIMKHRTEYDHTAYSADGLRNNPTLEAQIVDMADEIAYSTHDIDDGLGSGLITEKMLMELAIWNKSNSRFLKDYPDADQEIIRYYSVRNLINYLVSDLIANSTETIDGNEINSPDDARDFETPLIRFGPVVQKEVRMLKDFLYNKMYLHPRVHEKNEKARKVIAYLFKYFLKNPEKLSPASRKRFGIDPNYRVVCDYIAGMTDRYALRKYTEFTGEKPNLNITEL
jgi:dGTPase